MCSLDLRSLQENMLSWFYSCWWSHAKSRFKLEGNSTCSHTLNMRTLPPVLCHEQVTVCPSPLPPLKCLCEAVKKVRLGWDIILMLYFVTTDVEVLYCQRKYFPNKVPCRCIGLQFSLSPASMTKPTEFSETDICQWHCKSTKSPWKLNDRGRGEMFKKCVHK